ncbi:hypothetical protein V6582_21795 [Agrobacterium vitis]|uniref:hypothetical protein n=1 Tax=Agrobacterium vitis TaxID=373 RepID=UPI0018D2575C|nr:hypothetical protein [Agrobacterium vitis]
MIGDGEVFTACLVSESAGKPALAHAGWPDHEQAVTLPDSANPRPSHHSEPRSSQTLHTIENAAQRIRVNIAIHADASAPTKFDRYIAALPA